MYPEGTFGYWGENWAWGLPLVGASVVVHVLGLAATAWLVRRAFGHYLAFTSCSCW